MCSLGEIDNGNLVKIFIHVDGGNVLCGAYIFCFVKGFENATYSITFKP